MCDEALGIAQPVGIGYVGPTGNLRVLAGCEDRTDIVGQPRSQRNLTVAQTWPAIYRHGTALTLLKGPAKCRPMRCRRGRDDLLIAIGTPPDAAATTRASDCAGHRERAMEHSCQTRPLGQWAPRPLVGARSPTGRLGDR